VEESGVTAASWVRAANSVITWSHTEGAGRRGCKINTMEAMQKANPQDLVLVSKLHNHWWDLS